MDIETATSPRVRSRWFCKTASTSDSTQRCGARIAGETVSAEFCVCWYDGPTVESWSKRARSVFEMLYVSCQLRLTVSVDLRLKRARSTWNSRKKSYTTCSIRLGSRWCSRNVCNRFWSKILHCCSCFAHNRSVSLVNWCDGIPL